MLCFYSPSSDWCRTRSRCTKRQGGPIRLSAEVGVVERKKTKLNKMVAGRIQGRSKASNSQSKHEYKMKKILKNIKNKNQNLAVEERAQT